MEIFIVVWEPYGRYGNCEPMSLSIHQTEDVDALVKKLCDRFLPTKDDYKKEETIPTPLEWLQQANGDGFDYYMISELVTEKDGTMKLVSIVE